MSVAESQEIAARYIRENFAPSDRLAVVLLNKRIQSVVQRLTSAETLATREVQEWLADQNARHFEVYLSMNALAPAATSRTKSDVATIRHVYLDFDTNGTAAVEALLKRDDLPPLNYLINTSPGKWQAIWKVDGFTNSQAEILQRGLARDCGADPAATDCARVLRLPGFVNNKYARPYAVQAKTMAKETYRPEDFPEIAGKECGDRLNSGSQHSVQSRSQSPRNLSQSERDWAYAKRALARGESPALVIAAIAQHRRYDKHDRRYYAELTVKKAMETLADEARRNEPPRCL